MDKFIPKYKQISDDLARKIRNKTYLYGDTIPTEYELATEYDVSRYTIRKALSILDEDGYIKGQKGSGTYVTYEFDESQIEERLRNKTIGIITTHISEYIFPSIIRGIEDTLKKYNATLLLSSTDNDHNIERKSIISMMEKNVDGLIIEPTKSNHYNPNLTYYHKLRQEKIPYIMIHADYGLIDSNQVLFDDEKAGYDATMELIKNGHRRIATIIKYDDKQGKYRLKGYLKALEEAEIFLKDSIYIYGTHEEKKAVEDFFEDFEEGRFSAVFCYNDQIASYVLKKLSEKDLQMPWDLSITSIDNSIISQNLGISSVNHPKSDLGIKAAEWIMKSILNQDFKNQSYTFPGDLVIRGSVREMSKD
ncbi:MAG: GntR family transcriptional regulator [Tissierellia bacterium]|nr:GntR family transcriptional regulator [Tissierellia bacterium]